MKFLSLRNHGNGTSGLARMLDAHETGSTFALAGEALMNSLLAPPSGPPPRSVLVTSARPEEGKTTVATHLAITMALSGMNVLIVDADLRAPKLHEFFGLEQGVGVSNILDGPEVDGIVQSVIINPQADGPPRLVNVIGSGMARSHQFKMFGSSKMQSKVSELRDAFDFLIIDSPPVLAFSDALPLIRLVDGVVLVLRTGEVSEADAVAAKELIVRSGGRMLGVVMNLFVATQHGPGLSTGYGTARMLRK